MFSLVLAPLLWIAGHGLCGAAVQHQLSDRLPALYRRVG